MFYLIVSVEEGVVTVYYFVLTQYTQTWLDRLDPHSVPHSVYHSVRARQQSSRDRKDVCGRETILLEERERHQTAWKVRVFLSKENSNKPKEA